MTIPESGTILSIMNEQTANRVAEALGGTPWQSGGDIWLVLIHRSDGSIVAISDECVCEYADEDALNDGKAGASILLS